MTRPPRFILNYDHNHPLVVQRSSELQIPVAQSYRELVELGLKAEKRLGGKVKAVAPEPYPSVAGRALPAVGINAPLPEPTPLAPIQAVLQNEGVTEAFPPAPVYEPPERPTIAEKPKVFKASAGISFGPVPKKPGSMLKVKK